MKRNINILIRCAYKMKAKITMKWNTFDVTFFEAAKITNWLVKSQFDRY